MRKELASSAPEKVRVHAGGEGEKVEGSKETGRKGKSDIFGMISRKGESILRAASTSDTSFVDQRQRRRAAGRSCQQPGRRKNGTRAQARLLVGARKRGTPLANAHGYSKENDSWFLLGFPLLASSSLGAPPEPNLCLTARALRRFGHSRQLWAWHVPHAAAIRRQRRTGAQHLPHCDGRLR